MKCLINEIDNKISFEYWKSKRREGIFYKMLFINLKLLKNGLFLISILCLGYGISWSQTEHYASQNFNTTSALLSGAVVGGAAGVSASFYNPSLISEINERNLAINASLISINWLRLENGLGEGVDISSFTATVQPRFLSYAKSTEGNKKIDFEVSVLTRASDDKSIEHPYSEELDILSIPDGIENYTGSLGLRKKYKDLWIGFGASQKLSDNFYIGGSSFFSVKTLKYEYGYDMTAQPKSDTITINGTPAPYYAASVGFSELLNVWHLSLIFKLGVHYITTSESWEFGANLTFPSIGIYGNGKAQKEIFRTNIFNEFALSPVKDFNLFQYDRKVRANFKDPFSISAGFVHHFPGEQNILLFSIEYFHSIKPYEMIHSTSEPITTEENQTILEDEQLLSYSFAADNVLNVAVGFNKHLTDKVDFQGGLRTDFSNQKNLKYDEFENDSKFKIIPIDKYHITAGIELKLKKIDLLSGFQYSFGRENNIPYLVNMSDPKEYILSTGQSLQGLRESNMSISFNEFSLFFGFTYLL
jgi:hypothetical protein